MRFPKAPLKETKNAPAARATGAEKLYWVEWPGLDQSPMARAKRRNGLRDRAIWAFMMAWCM